MRWQTSSGGARLVIRLNLVAGAPLVEWGEWPPRLVEGSSKSAVAEGAVLGIGRVAATGVKKRDDSTTTDWAICPGSKGLFVPVLEPGFGRRDKSPWRLLSRVVEPGQKVHRAKKSFRPTGFEPKTYCLAHGFLTNSPK